ncbi:hypothetical protein [Dactylosporangium salmoneum]|uniref:OmpR/PhoB-type domain-containing protein n=1 Tax=Dactylosporangium salmoneum TaxID=53361 RepID=A0ABP5TY91_9ACTN
MSTGTLIEALWCIGPPPTARTQLQSCVLRLRRLQGAEAIASDPAGYGIRLGPRRAGR